jgi:hypothetical protein
VPTSARQPQREGPEESLVVESPGLFLTRKAKAVSRRASVRALRSRSLLFSLEIGFDSFNSFH